MIVIENQKIRVKINPLGAELTSLVNFETNTEYIWEANPTFWGKSSPVLFPIVGGLKNDTYFFKNQSYHLPRHGFARTMMFEVEEKETDSVVFLLTNNSETEKVYPFKFELKLVYTISNNKLEVKYIVKNTDNQQLWFSIGGHPAFKCPIDKDLNYSDYYLEFEKNEDLKKWPLNGEGLILDQPIEISKNSKILPLTKELFYEDALVFKNLASSYVTLKSDKSSKQLRFDFENFPYLGIWAAKNADFVCIQPWCGIADAANTNQNFTEKEGINQLHPDQVFERSFKIEM